jgi:hypothetical protein
MCTVLVTLIVARELTENGCVGTMGLVPSVPPVRLV